MTPQLWTDLIQTATIFFLGLYAIVVNVTVYRLRKRIEAIEEKRTAIYKALADPEKIAEEMEQGARLREMLDAKRTTLPREDAVGQNARVFRPKLRGKLPSQWNPPRA